MFSSLKWAGAAANDNSLTNSAVAFDPSLPCASGDEDARDAIIYADEPKKLIKRLQDKPQEIDVDIMYESAKGIFRLYENDIVEHVIKQEVKDKRVQMLLQRGEDANAHLYSMRARLITSLLPILNYSNLIG